MSLNYRGFWDPDSTYKIDDVVEYYDDAYNAVASYKCDVDFETSSTSAAKCPVQDYVLPPMPGTEQRIHLHVSTLASIVNVGSWASYKFFQAGIWEGPHGDTFTKSTSWTKGVAVNSEWSDLSNYSTEGQSYGAAGQTTLSQSKYGTGGELIDIEFDEVQGETDSDAYYLSSVQNYKGYFDSNEDYLKFDIVRDSAANLFYYARRDMTHVSGGDDEENLVLSDFKVNAPVEYVHSASHVGTITLNSGTLTAYHIGDVLDFSAGFTKDANKKKFTVLGVGETIMFLGSFGAAVDEDIMEFEDHSGADVNLVRSTATIDVATSDELWSYNKFFFDADYGSSVHFNARNKEYNYGDGYNSIAPLGINSLRIEFDLKFSNRSNREANAILHFLENHLGQHETDEKSYHLKYDQGISGFLMDDESLFFPYNNPENLTRRFYCFSFNHTIENEDVHTVAANIINTDASTLGVAHQIFVNKAPVWEANETYKQHDITFCPDNQKYYYSYGSEPQASYRPWVKNEDGTVTSKDEGIWTREFYWKPSLQVSTEHSPKMTELVSKASPYSQYYPAHKQNINPLEFSFKFENRNEKEAHAILHFLESHLGYQSFLFVPPAPYNRKRRFYCEGWKHTYVFRNNHTIEATFKQFPLGQNTPLTDDEIDNIAPVVPKTIGELAVQQDITLHGWQDYTRPYVLKTDPSVVITAAAWAALPADDGGGANADHQLLYDPERYYLKEVLTLGNVGQTDIEVHDVTAPSATSTKFSKSDSWGSYATSTSLTANEIGDASLGTYSVQSSPMETVHQNASIILQRPGWRLIAAPYTEITQAAYDLLGPSDKLLYQQHSFYSHTEIGEVYHTDSSTTNVGISPHLKDLLTIPSGGVIKPGEKYALEVYFDTNDTVDSDNPGKAFYDTMDVSYYYAPSDEVKYDSSDSYESGNIVQHDSKVWRASQDAPGVPGVLGWDRISETKAISLKAIVNPEMYDDKKDCISFAINYPSIDDLLTKTYDIQDSVDNVVEFRQRNKDRYLDLVWNASSEGAQLAVPSTLDQFEQILRLHTDLEGYLFLGIQKDGSDYKNYYTGDLIDVISPTNFTDPNNGDGYLALKPTKSGDKFQIKTLPENSQEAVGHVWEINPASVTSSLNIAQHLRSSGLLGEIELEELREVNVTLNGVFLGSSNNAPAVELGGGWHEGCTININLGEYLWQNKTLGDERDIISTEEYGALPSSDPGGGVVWQGDYEEILSSCHIIGRGGTGGTGMLSEGILYESGLPANENSRMSPPTGGTKGGDALSLSEISPTQTITINIISGVIYAGGGGGGGGGYQNENKRLQTSSYVNLAGGGGGGAGYGAGGFPDGRRSQLGADAGGDAGEAINNSPYVQSHLTSGGEGGGFGQPGENSGSTTSANFEILSKGGSAGRAITWRAADPVLVPSLNIVQPDDAIKAYSYDTSGDGAGNPNGFFKDSAAPYGLPVPFIIGRCEQITSGNI